MVPLTVVQIIPSLQYGGVEKGTLEIAKGLVEKGHRSIVIAGKGPLEAALQETGSEYISWEIGKKRLRTLQYIFRLAQFLKKQRPHILHVRSRLPAWVTHCALLLIPRRERPRLITTVHGLYSVNVYSSVMVRSDQVIAVSNTAKRYIENNYPWVDSQKIQVIYRGIDPVFYFPEFTPSENWLNQWKTQRPLLIGKKILALPARVSPRKGIEDFIALIAALKKRGCAVHGLIVGSAHGKKYYLQQLENNRKDAGLAQDVTFLGGRSDLREIIAVSDIVFSLSQKPESFGRTVVEALSLGKPVIGYDNGGVGEILGLLYQEGRVPPLDRGALLAKTIAFLERAPAPAPQTLFLTSKMVEQTIALYESKIF